METLIEPFHERLDRLEAAIAEAPQLELEVIHRFVPGMYIREIYIPAGAVFTTAQHNTEHPFVLLKGDTLVSSETEGSVRYSAPMLGITKPGTRRAVFAETDVIYVTFHANPDDGQDIEAIAERILEPRVNPLLGPDHPSLNNWQKSNHEPPCLS